MYEITIQDTFSAAHQLREYGGKCEELHGHNWRVDVVVKAEQLDATGLAIDFRILKEHTRMVLETLDHAFLNKLPQFRDVNPSSENIARYIFQQLDQSLAPFPVVAARVNVWESDRTCASYIGEGS